MSDLLVTSRQLVKSSQNNLCSQEISGLFPDWIVGVQEAKVEIFLLLGVLEAKEEQLRACRAAANREHPLHASSRFPAWTCYLGELTKLLLCPRELSTW